MALGATDVVLNRFEADDDAEAGRPSRMMRVMSKPFIDRVLKSDVVDDLPDLLREIKARFVAKTGQERGPFVVTSLDDVVLLQGHPRLGFKGACGCCVWMTERCDGRCCCSSHPVQRPVYRHAYGGDAASQNPTIDLAAAPTQGGDRMDC